MAQPSIKKNFLFSSAYQVLTMIIPLITAPYVSRVLGPTGVGIYSYTSSIQMYFSLFAALGTASYGTREIARNRNDFVKRSKLFWEIEQLTVVTTMICLIFWGIWILFHSKYRIYYIVLTFSLLATMFDISWFYMGIERFQYIVTQNTIFKIAGIVALFVFVKDQDDVVMYAVIMSLSTCLGNISMWIYLPKFVEKISWKHCHLLPHFKETLVYFIPTIATSIYTILDKTLIGVITQDIKENGYYEQATKILNICKSLTFTSLNSVLGARISFLYAEEKLEEVKEKIIQSMDYILFMGIGICFGLIGVSNLFVPIFFGEGYEQVVFLLQLLSPLVIIIGISNCLGSQYYTPAGRRKQSAGYLIIGSVVNLILNLVLIPYFQSYGAVVATVIAEMVITWLYVSKCDGMITVGNLFKCAWKKLLAAVVMIVIIILIEDMIQCKIVALALEVLVGGVSYVVILYLLQDTFVYGLIKKMIHKKR